MVEHDTVTGGPHDGPWEPGDQPPASDRLAARDWRWLAVIVGLAVIVRLVHVLCLTTSPLFDSPSMDPGLHTEWARQIVAGTLPAEPYFRAPLYLYFVSLFFAVLGDTWATYLAIRVVQAVIGALSCGLLFLIGRRVHGRAAGVLAGITVALYRMLVYFDGELLLPVLIVALMVTGTALLVAAVRRPRWPLFLAAGVSLGLAAITRPNALAVVPVVVVWTAGCRWRDGAGLRRAVVSAAVVMAGVAAAVAPVTLRNLVVGHDLVLISSQAGVNFYIGNNPRSDGKTAVVPGARSTWAGGYEDTIAIAEQAVGHPLSPSEVSAYWLRAGCDFLRHSPRRALRLYLTKLRLLLDTHEVSNNQDIEFMIHWIGDLALPLFPTLALLAPLAAAGILLNPKDRWWWLLTGIAGAYLASFLPFFITARYRVPAVPFLILIAAGFTVATIADARARRWPAVAKRLAVTAVATVLFAAISSPTPAVDLDAPGPGHYTLGNAFLRQGDYVAARYHFTRLLAYHEPYRSRSMLNLGRLSYLTGDRAAAIDWLGTAVAANPVLEREATEFLRDVGAPELVPVVTRTAGPSIPYPG